MHRGDADADGIGNPWTTHLPIGLWHQMPSYAGSVRRVDGTTRTGDLCYLRCRQSPVGYLQRIDALAEARVRRVRIIPRCGSRETHYNQVRHCSGGRQLNSAGLQWMDAEPILTLTLEPLL